MPRDADTEHTQGPAQELAAHDGLPTAFGELLESYRAYLLSIAQREMSAELAAKVGASDIVQEAFLEAHLGLARFRGTNPNDLLGWLRGILLNRLSRHHRAFLDTNKRDARREVEAGSNLEIDAGLRTPSSTLSVKEQLSAVRAAMDRLPVHYRQILIWRQWDDLSFEDIAKRLDKSPDAARMLWWRAAERLQQELRPSHESTV